MLSVAATVLIVFVIGALLPIPTTIRAPGGPSTPKESSNSAALHVIWLFVASDGASRGPLLLLLQQPYQH